VGELLTTSMQVQFLETLANLVSNGLPLLRGLELTRNTFVNVHVRSRLMAERLPGVYPDDDAAVQLVVGHFVDRGVRQLAFCPSAADGSSGPCDSILHHAATHLP
jgi:hypothetical protein